MRTILLSILCLILSVACFSQITLTRENSFPIAGDTFTYYRSSINNPGDISDDIGTVWDFSVAEDYDGEFELQFVSPSENEFSELFPQPDIVNQSSLFDLDLNYYYQVSENVISSIGDHQPGYNIVYTDGFDELRFPFTLGDSFQDTFSAYDLSDPDALEPDLAGTVNTEARSIGTLILPGGIETTVLKITQEITWEYSSGMITSTVMNLWYDGISRTHLAKQFQTFSGKAVGFEHFEYLSAEDFNFLSVEEKKEADFKLFPNPTTDQLTIEFKQKSPNKSYTITDFQGRIILSDDFINSSKNTIKIDDLTSGVYILDVSSDSISSAKRFIVE